MKKQILELLEEYRIRHLGEPEEIKKVESFLNYLNSNENITDRKNMNGHVTVSGFIVENNKTLLLWHKAMQRYQQPGGHIDPGETDIFEVAIRELKEETGLDAEKTEGIFSNYPINIGVNFKVNENRAKGESEHFHFDLFIFLKLKNSKQELKNEDDGTENATWVNFDEVKQEVNPYVFETILKYKAV